MRASLAEEWANVEGSPAVDVRRAYIGRALCARPPIARLIQAPELRSAV